LEGMQKKKGREKRAIKRGKLSRVARLTKRGRCPGEENRNEPQIKNSKETLRTLPMGEEVGKVQPTRGISAKRMEG